MKAQKGSRIIIPLILNLGARWRWRAQRQAPAVLPPGKSCGVPCKGGWVGSGAILYRGEEEKICCPQRGLYLEQFNPW